jgi:hypothetical protein
MTGSRQNFPKAEPELQPKARTRTEKPGALRYSFIDHTGFSRGGAS